jgi:two-component system response regulator YesN
MRNGDQFGIYLMQYLKQYFESGGEAGFTAGSLRLLYRTQREIRFVMDVLTEADFERKCGTLRSGLETLNRILQVQYGNTVTVAFSGLSEDALPPRAHSLPVLLRAAEDALKCRMYLGPGHLILQEEVGPKELPLSPMDPAAVRECVRGLSLSGCETYIRGLFDTLQKRKVTSSDFVRGICVSMKNLLLSTLQESGIDLNWLTESNAELLNDIPDYATIAEYRDWTDSLFYLILSGIAQITGKQHSRVIVEAMDYIAKHYNQDISLDAVADHVSKSRNYFSYLFKKEVGMTYVEYLNTIRVEKARRLLDTTDDMAYEIAAKVGYSDSRYFSMVFKKLTGVAPNQYRNRES